MSDASPDELDPAYQARVMAAYRALCEAEGVRLIRDADFARRMVDTDPSLKTGYQQAGRLLSGTRSRHRPTMIAFARVLGVDPGWLDYGPASAAPAPAFSVPPVTPAPTAPVPKLAAVPVHQSRAHRAQAQIGKKKRRGGS